MKAVVLSDTHGLHQEVNVPPGDILIHCGDFTRHGRQSEVNTFLEWLGGLPHSHKLFIGGNHDFLLDYQPELFRALLDGRFLYLENSGVTLNGIRFWGSPITPFFYNWAFNRHRGQEIAKYWNAIPPDTDVLITHGPPYGILDQTTRGLLVGCSDLKHRIDVIQPKFHLFGHIHEAYGQVYKNGVHFVNASITNEYYLPINPPIELDLSAG